MGGMSKPKSEVLSSLTEPYLAFGGEPLSPGLTSQERIERGLPLTQQMAFRLDTCSSGGVEPLSGEVLQNRDVTFTQEVGKHPKFMEPMETTTLDMPNKVRSGWQVFGQMMVSSN